MEELEEPLLSVVQHLRKNVPVKTAQIKKHGIEYVKGSKLIDCLMTIKETLTDDREVDFPTREEAAKYCKRLLDKRCLVGAKKIEMGINETDDSKKKRKFRVDWQPATKIVDSPEEIYVWTYELPTRYRLLVGIVLVLGVFGFTIQQLWPQFTMYIITFSLVSLLAILIAIYLVRWFLWGLLLAVTSGKLDFCIFPNLDNEKLGVIDSFKPLYSVKWKSKKKHRSSERDEKDDKKTK